MCTRRDCDALTFSYIFNRRRESSTSSLVETELDFVTHGGKRRI